MNKRIIKITLIIVIISIIVLIPIKKESNNIITYNAIAYKYIIWNEESLYNNAASNEIHIFPLNFQSLESYREESIPLAYASYNDSKVELILGTAVWKKRNYDAIFPIARDYKEILNVSKDATIELSIGSLEITDIKIYDVETTNQVKTETSYDKNKITLKDLDKKQYVISITTENKNGKVSYSFKINIE